MQKVTKDGNPFPVERAEGDRTLLFSKAAFWPRHPLFEVLAKTDHPQIVFGEHGSGRSTLALALGQHSVLGLRFRLYLSGQPDVAQITTGFAQQLLTCIQAYPTLLSRLAPPEMALLARVLANVLGRDFVLAEVKSIQNSDKWLSKVKSPEDEKKWKRTSDVQLSLLGGG